MIPRDSEPLHDSSALPGAPWSDVTDASTTDSSRVHSGDKARSDFSSCAEGGTVGEGVSSGSAPNASAQSALLHDFAHEKRRGGQAPRIAYAPHPSGAVAVSIDLPARAHVRCFEAMHRADYALRFDDWQTACAEIDKAARYAKVAGDHAWGNTLERISTGFQIWECADSDFLALWLRFYGSLQEQDDSPREAHQ